jgi:DNA-binding phage protein
MNEHGFKALIARARERDSYWVAKSSQDFTEGLFGLMEARGVTKAELARRIGSSPAYITKALRGDANFTLATMVRMVRALDGQLCLHVARREDRVRWFGIPPTRGEQGKVMGAEGFHSVSQARFRGHDPVDVVSDESASAAA